MERAAIRNALSAGGIPTRVSDDIIAAMWVKFFGFATAAAVASLTRSRAGVIARTETGTSFVSAVIEECARIVTAEGYPPPANIAAALRTTFSQPNSEYAPSLLKPFKQVDEAVVRYLSLAESRRLVNACPEDFRNLVEAALYTGCRYAELGRLKYEDYNDDSGTLSVRLSKGKNRHVVLTEEAKGSFRRWTKDIRPGERIFLRSDGRVWGTSHQQRPLDGASNRAAITPAVNFHILRHTHASYLAMAGVPMAVIARQLGHADTRMTEKHYAHLAPNYVAQTIRQNFPVLGLANLTQVIPLISAGSSR